MGWRNMMKSTERREAYRIPFASQVRCHIDKINKTYSGALRDVSIIGLFMEIDDRPSENYKCDIDIVVESQHSRLKIEHVKGTIIRGDNDGMAIRFDERLEWFAMVTLCSHKQREQFA